MTTNGRKRQTGWTTVEAIKEYIRDHGLEPGSLLPTEGELCEELGVSRSSVREAIRTLVSLDIVDVRHGHGTYVGSLSLAPLVSGLVFRGSLNQDGTFATLREVLQLRIALDLGVADELAAAYRGTTNTELHALVDQMRTLNDVGSPFVEADGEFHRQLLQPLDNTIVRQLVAAFWEVHTQVVPMLGIPTAADMHRTVEAHEHMISALEQGDVQGYRDAVIEHYQPLQRQLDLAGTQQAGPELTSTR